MTGFKLAGLIFASVIATPILTLGFFELRKSYWDFEVRRLCAIDGGLKVHEVAELSRREFELLRDSLGQYVIRPETQAGAAPIVRTENRKIIKEWNPKVWRVEQSAIRRSDNKMIATHVDYARVGGDLIAFHSSSFLCPGTPALQTKDIVKVKDP